MKRALAALAALPLLALAACGSSGGGSDDGGSGSKVNVLYAGSLVTMMQSQVGPGFAKATDYSVNGYSGGSSDLATEISGKVHAGDVFISASPTVNETLQGKKNGDWVSWYATYATSPLVLGYNKKSKFAKDLKSKAWYDAITEKGFRIGRTDPKTDPKGALAAQALSDNVKKASGLAAIGKSTSNVFPEETLVGRLQSGQLDAGFFYKSEAVAAHIPYVPLTGVHLKATYTVTVLNNAPNPKGAAAFVSYLLGPKGEAILKKDGFSLVSPAKVTGSGVPSALKSVLSGS